MSEKNIYITAIEYAIQQGQEGINFNELKEYLDRLFPGYIDKFSESFKLWFFKYFYHPAATFKARRYETGQQVSKFSSLDIEFDKYLGAQVYLSYEAHMEYFDYAELKEAREASQKAQRNAKTAIIISIIALSIAILFSVLESILSLSQIILGFLL